MVEEDWRTKARRERELCAIDGSDRGCGVRYDLVVDRHLDDHRYQREEEARSNGSGVAIIKPSLMFDTLMRMELGRPMRSIEDKISDPNRPTWEDYKQVKADKLDIAGVDEKKMRAYREKLDAEREEKLARARERKKLKKKKDKKEKKKGKKKGKKGERKEGEEEEEEEEEVGSEDEGEGSKEGGGGEGLKGPVRLSHFLDGSGSESDGGSSDDGFCADDPEAYFRQRGVVGGGEAGAQLLLWNPRVEDEVRRAAQAINSGLQLTSQAGKKGRWGPAKGEEGGGSSSTEGAAPLGGRRRRWGEMKGEGEGEADAAPPIPPGIAGFPPMLPPPMLGMPPIPLMVPGFPSMPPVGFPVPLMAGFPPILGSVLPVLVPPPPPPPPVMMRVTGSFLAPTTSHATMVLSSSTSAPTVMGSGVGQGPGDGTKRRRRWGDVVGDGDGNGSTLPST